MGFPFLFRRTYKNNNKKTETKNIVSIFHYVLIFPFPPATPVEVQARK